MIKFKSNTIKIINISTTTIKTIFMKILIIIINRQKNLILKVKVLFQINFKINKKKKMIKFLFLINNMNYSYNKNMIKNDTFFNIKNYVKNKYKSLF